MKVTDLLSEIRDANLYIEVIDDQIKLDVLGNKPPTELLEKIRQQKAELITFLKKNRVEEINPAEITDYYPASSEQKRLYTLQVLDKDSTVYNLLLSYTLRGKIDTLKIENTFKQLIERHESFRTSLKLLDGILVQKIEKEVLFEIDYGHHDNQSLNQYIKNFSRPFDLSSSPLLRVGLYMKSEMEYALLIDMHHSISDGVSLAILMRDFKLLYDQQQLPELPLQYKDYSVWKQKEISENVLKEDKDFWLDQFKGEIPILNLPTDYKRQPIIDYKGDTEVVELDQDITQAIHQKCKEKRITLFLFLFGAFKVLLNKYSTQSDIVVGTINAGRDRDELKNIVGMFANTMAIRSAPEASKSFIDFVDELKEICFEAFAHQHYPFEELVGELNLERDMGRNPLFDVLFVLQNMEAEKFSIGDLDVNYLPIDQKFSKFDISLSVLERDGKLVMYFEYSTNLFSKETIQRMGKQFCYMLKTLSEDTNLLINDIELTPLQERHDVIEGFNKTEYDHPLNKTVVHLFEEQVAKTPDNIALVYNNNRLSYSEFSERVDHFASFLLSKGIQKGDIVGVIGSRSLDLVSSLFGILKVSACYLPIDPLYPQERIEYVLKDSATNFVLFDSEFENILPGNIEKASFKEVLSTEKRSYSESENLPESSDLAYVIYTSGSTGTPKGVMVNHHSVTNVLCALNRLYPCLEQDSYLFKTSYCFDVSVSEIFGWIFNGGRLVILENGYESQPNEIEKIIDKERVTHINFVPSMFKALLDSIRKEQIVNYNPVKYFMIAGEAFTPDLVETYNALGLTANLENIYGPTEATIYVSYFSLKDWRPNTRVPIGKPVDNVKLYVLDEEMKPQTIGIPGELYIGGAALARGYMNHLELSAEKFIVDSDNPLQKLYKTGDLVRWLPSGNIEYFGRIDSQVKIRGYRIELGEIETTLNKHEAIDESVVIARTLKGDKHICAYLVLNRDISLDSIKVFLTSKLPAYMVPGFITEIDKIPLLSNGKINKRALIDPILKAQSTEDFRSPANELEEKLVNIWSENLGIDKNNISTNISYFEIGGNSLKLISLLSTINDTFKTDISLKQLYIHKNIGSLSELISSSDKSTQSSYPKITHDANSLHQPFPLSNIQFAYLVGRDSHLELGNISTHSFWRIEAEADLESVNRCLNILIERHHALRTIVTEEGEQVVLNREDYVINVRDISKLSKSEQNKISTEIANRMSKQNFDTSKWPLFEITALKENSENYIFFISLDTIVADAYSMELLRNEFKHLYKNTKAPLDDLTITFRDYIIALTKFKESPLYAKHKDFWLNKLSDFPSTPPLPLARNLSDVEKPNFKAIRKTFSVHESNLIKDFSKRGNVSLSTVLLTVYSEVLSYWSNQAKFALNLTFFNRIPFHESINKIVGDFTSLILLDISLNHQASFQERMTSVQNTLLEALDHRLFDGVEFIREISKQRNLARKAVMPVVFTSALFDTAFNVPESSDKELSFSRDRINIERGTPTSQVYLDNVVGEQNGRIFLIWNYIEELFSVDDINRMFDLYVAKLYDLIAQTNQYTKAVKQDVHNIYETYNNTDTSVLKIDTTIHELISKQCKKTPGSIAVTLGRQSLTYAELDKQSNWVANYLTSKGVINGETVCVLGERKIETIINILGVLKIGAIYVPLSPDNPENRNRRIQRDCNAQILLDPNNFNNNIKSHYSDEFQLVRVQPDDTAYIIFTSGSTGTPKGVVISHTSAINTILDINDQFNVGVNDRILQISSFSFDLSIYDIFGSLVCGAELVMLKTNKSVEEIVQALIRHEVTIFNAVPSFWKLVVENLPYGELLESLRHVMLSGDWIPVNLARQTIEQFPHLQLTSLGGATEGSIWSIYYPVREVNPNWKSIPYGYPLRNQKFYILNFENELCPIGVKGMLFIGGVGVTKGYINDQKQTHNSLLQHPTYGLLYKTGDFGVMHPEGYIEFLGREDDQVKIKGHRIELGEIEKNINNIKAIKNSIVSVHRGENRDFLVAHVIENNKKQATGNGLFTDTAKQLDFKLAQHGLRHFSNDAKVIQLSKRINNEISIEVSKPILKTNKLSSSIKFDHLEMILESLRQFDQQEYQFPKYLYPSAGNLYPIQVYLSIGENSLTNLGPGYYYYNPNTHSIVFINNNKEVGNQEYDQFLLVAKKSAIEPIYREMAERFCLLEAGHIIGLLNDVSCVHNIGLSKIPNDSSILERLELASDHFLTGSYRFGYKEHKGVTSEKTRKLSIYNRQSYRNYLDDEIGLGEFSSCLQECFEVNSDCHNLSFYFYIKEGRLKGMKSGYYYFDSQKNELQKVGEAHSIESLYDVHNKELYDSSGFAIFLVASEETSNQINIDTLVEAGRVGQSMNTIFPLYDLGICAIGSVKSDIMRSSTNLNSHDQVIYSFLGGKITKEQTLHKDSDQNLGKSLTISDIIKENLEKNLPEYMIPNYIIPIEKFPLTQNGKVNRKLLPLPDFKSNKEFVEPKGEVEIKLSELINTLLNSSEVGATDDFFELGGDSLKAMALIARINKNFNIGMDLSTFFSRPTIQELASFIESVQIEINDEVENMDRYHI